MRLAGQPGQSYLVQAQDAGRTVLDAGDGSPHPHHHGPNLRAGGEREEGRVYQCTFPTPPPFSFHSSPAIFLRFEVRCWRTFNQTGSHWQTLAAVPGPEKARSPHAP